MADLFNRAQSFLAVIDVQEVFLRKLAPEDLSRLVARVVWLIGVARALDVPVLAMAEDVASNGGPVEAVRTALPDGMRVHDKQVFGLAGQTDILDAARALQRTEAVLVGLETDVCVAQSALGLRSAGFRVAAVSDATGSPGEDHAAGIVRMAGAGVAITRSKGIFYEWVRDLPTLARYRALKTSAQSAGIAL